MAVEKDVAFARTESFGDFQGVEASTQYIHSAFMSKGILNFLRQYCEERLENGILTKLAAYLFPINQCVNNF